MLRLVGDGLRRRQRRQASRDAHDDEGGGERADWRPPSRGARPRARPSISVARVTGSTLPSGRARCSPLTRRRPPPQVAHLGRQPALGEAERHCERGRGDCLRRDPSRRPRSTPVSSGKASPGEREPQVGVEAAAGELEVVGADDEDAGERRTAPIHGSRVTAPYDPDRRRDRRSRRRRARRAPAPGCRFRSGRPLQLVERVGADADGEEERRERRRERRDAKAGRERGSDHDVREVPGGVGRMEERDVVAPATRRERVERRAREVSRHGVPR